MLFAVNYIMYFSAYLCLSVSLVMTSPLLSSGDCSTGCIRSHSWKTVPSISLQFSFLALTVILLLLITFVPSSKDLIKKSLSCTVHSRNDTDYGAYCFRLGSLTGIMTYNKDWLILSLKHCVHADWDIHLVKNPFGFFNQRFAQA